MRYGSPVVTSWAGTGMMTAVVDAAAVVAAVTVVDPAPDVVVAGGAATITTGMVTVYGAPLWSSAGTVIVKVPSG